MPRFEPEHLRERPEGSFARERDVRFQDVDAAGIVFFPRVLEYFSDLFLEFLAAHGGDVPSALRQRTWGAPIRHAEADYFRPLRFGDRVEIAIVRCSLAPTVVTLGYRVAKVADGEVTGIGQTVHVFVELAGFERCAIPEPVAAGFARLPR